MPQEMPIEDQKELEYMQSFSSDVIASLSLLPEYDMKRLAHAIARFFGQHSGYTLTYNPEDIEAPPERETPLPDLLPRG